MTTFNVMDYGAEADGVTDDTAAFQAATQALKDASGDGTLDIPGGFNYCLSSLAASAPWALTSGMTVNAEGAVFLRPNAISRAMVVVNTSGTPGYGAGVDGLQWNGGTFRGDLANQNYICAFGTHHLKDAEFIGITFENCQAHGSHMFDLVGAYNVLIDTCNFLGQRSIDDTQNIAEAVQFSHSFSGGLTGGTDGVGLPGYTAHGFSGLPSYKVIVQDSYLGPFTDGEGNYFPGPTAFGGHGAAEGLYFDDMAFLRNHVKDTRASLVTDDNDPDDRLRRGTVHLPAVRRARVNGNLFEQTQGRFNRVIAAASNQWGPVAGTNPDAPHRGDWAAPNLLSDLTIEDNTIRGFPNEAVFIHGIGGFPIDGVSVQRNSIEDCTDGVVLTEVTNAVVSGETINVDRPVVLDSVTGFTVGPLTATSDSTQSAVVTYRGATSDGRLNGIKSTGYRSDSTGFATNVQGDGSSGSGPGRRLVFTAWDKNFNRKGQIGKIISRDLTLRHNTLGSCEFTVSARNPRIADLVADGARVTVDYYPDATSDPIRYSGMVTNIHGEGRAEQATRTITVGDDWNVLNTTPAYPNPTGSDSQQGDSGAYYTITNKHAETLIKQVVAVNATRLGLNLTIEPDQGRGDIIPKMTFRMHPIADRAFPKVDQAGIGVRIVQVADHLELQVYEPTEYPRVLTEDSKIIQGGSFDLTAATLTRVLVGAGGEGTARVFKHYIGSAEAQLGTALEQFIDARDIPPTVSSDDDPPVVSPNPDLAADMQARADEALAEGAKKSSMDLTLVERGAFRFGKTFQLGDRISVQMNDGPVITDLVRAVQITQGVGEPIRVTPMVGDWAESTDSGMAKIIAQIAKSIRDIKRR